MIRCLVFSRDRAMQLDAVLRSFLLHARDADEVEVCILYKTTDQQHEKQYGELKKEYAGRVTFKQQQNFRSDVLSYLDPFEKDTFESKLFRVLSALGRFGPPLGSALDRIWRRTVAPVLIFLSTLLVPASQEDTFILFLVDDNLFVQDFHVRHTVGALRERKALLGFSLRLGENTTYRYSRGQPQPLPTFTTIQDGIVCFDWTKAKGDFGYPLEVSSSIYRTCDLLPLLMGFAFDNPNVLEERMAFHARLFRKEHPLLACYQRSVTFCNPVNVVQSVAPNRAGERIKYEIGELLSRFEQGDRVNVASYSGFIPHACHQEVALVFENLGEEV